MSTRSELYITRYDGQPLDEQQAEGLWNQNWREWLIHQGYLLVRTTQIPFEDNQPGATLEVWQREGKDQQLDNEDKVVEFVVYHSPFGKEPNSAGLYLAIAGEAALDELLQQL
jgi:hypothetical protein